MYHRQCCCNGDDDDDLRRIPGPKTSVPGPKSSAPGPKTSVPESSGGTTMDIDSDVMVVDTSRPVKGRGRDEDDGRYKGKGGIFESLQEAEEASADMENPLKSIEGWIIIVTGLHEETTEDDISSSFEEYGEIKNIHLNLDRRTGFVKGYALIEYETYKQAKAAIEGMNGRVFCEMPILVSWAFTKQRGRGR